MTTKVYGFLQGKEAVAITEKGQWVCGNIVNSEVEAMNMLSIKLDTYNQKFGKDGWTFEYIPLALAAAHEELQAALAAHNHEMSEKLGLKR